MLCHVQCIIFAPRQGWQVATRRWPERELIFEQSSCSGANTSLGELLDRADAQDADAALVVCIVHVVGAFKPRDKKSCSEARKALKSQQYLFWRMPKACRAF
jgi:hypothetical protein